MRERGKTIVELAPNPRYESWEAGLNIIKTRPLLGVGLNKFVSAYYDYSPEAEIAHVAHSAYIQIAAECGIFAGLMFLMLNINMFYQYWRHRSIKNDKVDTLLLYSGDAAIASLLGYFTCSIFLDLAWYEIFYYLLVLSIIWLKLLNREKENVSKQVVHNVAKN
jgi:O-antigen ligase